MARLYPLIEYAHKIGKNTAELTAVDMANFMKWYMKQPPRKDLMEGTAAQRKTYNQDVAAMKQWREEEKMGKHVTKKYEEAQTSRLAERGIESPINDGEEEIIIHPENEIACSMELTKKDIAALLFSISRTFEDYEMEGHEYGVSLIQLKEGLEGI